MDTRETDPGLDVEMTPEAQGCPKCGPVSQGFATRDALYQHMRECLLPVPTTTPWTLDTPLDEWLEALDEMETAESLAIWRAWWQEHCDPAET